MRRLALCLCALLFTTATMTAQSQPPSPAPQPKAQKMDSDAVWALVEKEQVFFLDVREPDELEKLGTLEGYVNIPLGQIEQRLAEIPKDKAIITA